MWTEPLLLQDLLGTAPERVVTRSSWGTDPFRGNFGALWMKPRVAILAPTRAQNPPVHAQEPSCLLPSPSTLVASNPATLVNSVLAIAASCNVGDAGTPSN